MTLTDTGPLVALLDKDDSNHSVCVKAARRLPSVPMLTTWPCFTEAMYLLGKVGGFGFQAELWSLYSAGRLVLDDLSAETIDRTLVLMHKYQDTPMDLADASLVALAESRTIRRIFTLDRGFHFYRLDDGSVLDIVP